MEQLAVHTAQGVSEAIAAIGRTEDVHFSPSNRRLAVAGFKKNTILVLSVKMGGRPIEIDAALTVTCSAFSYPHGVFWLDDDRLIVANRGGGVAIVNVPDRHNTREVQVEALCLIGEDATDLLLAPGSVYARRVGGELTELLVCNNSGHYVSRHVLVSQGLNLSAISAEIAAREGLSIPDGISCDEANGLAAVSNHNDHSVYVYRMADFGPGARPACVLRGLSYAHGLRFTRDGKVLLVADAGEPFIHVFHSPDGRWENDLEPISAIRVVDQDTFIRGRENDQEGGPKGIDLSMDGRILVASCHEQPLAFFEIGEYLDEIARPSRVVEPAVQSTEAYLIERLIAARRDLRDMLKNGASSTTAHRRILPSQVDDLERALEAMRASTSWRLTAPLRWLTAKLRRGAR